MADITLAGEQGLLVTFTGAPTPETSRRIIALADFIEARFPTGINDVVPSYTTLGVFFEPAALTRPTVMHEIREWLERPLSTGSSPAIETTLPVYYGTEVAPDLVTIAERTGLTPDEIVQLHTRERYHAYANGFAPGFCYLGHLNPRLSQPRRSTPRARVPKGSVAIADRQTAVYPVDSPGGWHLIGRCPLPLFNPESRTPNLISVGTFVRFKAIERSEFLDLGGSLE
ncbi:conserved hypothetical protein TIGR00370 [Luminiphilus syltensis NOR5-1B]|uniref:Carboxyltransferase domain-containing protein n=1 Tax=Luminiphilus syltensis NOR5-1B TaxID=565045 RepID=B8KSD5_9GAMM|nr:5-oxoprolinase subunit PxpB [Luminiphilus syltensis]EED35893.1 conserved hypothetical protein TIGR00370 [Luminiphilus syltensis NOR5-1B]